LTTIISARSGLPVPARVSAPGAEPVTVLDWAGFDGAVSFTFDDTQPSQIQHWREILATGVRATWYFSPTFRRSAAFDTTWAAAAAAGHEIGGHTAHHDHVSELAARYPGLSTAEAAARELDDCDDAIAVVTGQSAVWTFAYPYGDREWKRYLGGRYLFARTVNDGAVRPEQDLDPLALPSYTVQAGDTKAVFEAKIDEAVAEKSWRTLLFHALLPTDQNWYAGVPAADVVASLEYGKALGTVWLDSVVNVGCYWMGARLLRQAPVSKDGSLTWSWSLPKGFPRGHFVRVVSAGQLSQSGGDLTPVTGFYEVALDAGSLTWRPRI
jgi:peptidoglycan/xylan/chitin deacetylase (PgdA/CDA1 family)